MLLISAIHDDYGANTRDARQRWSAFHEHAGLDILKGKPGVYCLTENAWIFDLEIARALYERVLDEADRTEWVVRVFNLGNAAGCDQTPPEPELIKFLAS